MDNVDLKPCPFCGGEVKEVKHNLNVVKAVCVHCEESWGYCGVKFKGRFELWNRRAIKD